MLRLKIDSWKLFCERLGVPPFATWRRLPGFGRLERALKLAEAAAFRPEGMLRHLNDLRPEGEPELPKLTTLPFTAEATAAGLERFFRKQVAWWGGE